MSKQERTRKAVLQWLQENGIETADEQREFITEFATWSGYRPPGQRYRQRKGSDPKRESQWKTEWLARNGTKAWIYLQLQKGVNRVPTAAEESDPLRSIRNL